MIGENASLSLKNKKFLAIAGAIALGILGNGLWEYAAKPILLLSRDTLLNIATLGIQSFKDSCYLLIAQGFTESASFHMLSEYNGLYISVFIFAVIYLIIRMKEVNEKFSHIGDIEMPKLSHDERKNKIKKSLSQLKILVWIFVVLSSFVVCTKILSSVKESYVRSAIINYKQTLHIVKPFITERECQLIDSRFSQITCKKDYSAIMSSLYAICDKNQVKHTFFDPW